jgi:hypothetical protein
MIKKFLYIGIISILLSALVACSDAEVTKADYGDDWPLTVESGVLKCLDDNGLALAIIEVNGVEYQLNGAAKSRGYDDIDTIWSNNPNIPGTRVSLSPLIRKALELCN